MIDTGASLNLITLSTLEVVGMAGKRILGALVEIMGFGGVAESTEGYVTLALRVGPIVTLTRFHVINSKVSYHILLGQPWLYKHLAEGSWITKLHDGSRGDPRGCRERSTNSVPKKELEEVNLKADLGPPRPTFIRCQLSMKEME